jgi:O-antigen/teichoic acid export membrane protein
VRWALQLALPSAVAVGAVLPLLMGAPGDPLEYVVAIAALTVFLMLDVVRFRLYSLDAVWSSVVAGAGSLALLAGTVTAMAVTRVSVGWLTMTAAWIASGGTALCLALWLARRRSASAPGPGPRVAALRTVLSLGAWSGIDQLLSSAANIGPLLVSNLVLRSDLSGLYRLFQSTQAPLNIATTAALTAFGLDAWSLTSREALTALKRRVARVSVALGAASLLYFAGAELVVVAVTGVRSADLGRVALIVAVAGVLGALTIGVSAGSNALGRQRNGVLLRLLVVAVSATLITLSYLRVPILWNDPVGVLAIASTVINLAGWSITFRRAERQERRALTTPVDAWAAEIERGGQLA